ncbi:DMT family transporter [Psychrobacter arenosus]|uniref:DMT family transporter n=1 Tax=Psychrobacter arenosus TaxID=256326 RepID=UPI00191A2013|nr:DMT family transporter [Psychrobacter arenosus]
MSGVTKTERLQHRRSWLIPCLCLLAGGMLLGVTTNLAKYAGTIGLTPVAFLFWSISGAALILLLVALLRSELPPLTARSFEYYIVAALVSVAGANLIFFSAIPQVGAGFVAMTIALPPLLTYLGALALRIESFQPLRAFGVAAALLGAGVLAAHKFAAPNVSVVWVLIALCGPVLLAIGNIYRTLRWPPNASPSALAPGMLIAAAVQLGLVGMLPNFSLAVPLVSASIGGIFGSLSVGLIVLQAVLFAGQFLLLFLLQKTGGPVLLSLLGAVGAVVGVPIAVFIQGEAPPEGLILGASLIAIGVISVTLGGVRMLQGGEKSA